MQVFKFGGASVNSVERIRNVADILKRYPDEPVMVIVSAMGKTTNALERVAEAFFNGEKEGAIQLFEELKQVHIRTARELLGEKAGACLSRMQNFFTEVEWLLHDRPVRDFDYYYDQVVCAGELLSSSLVSAGLETAGISNRWIDVRDVFRTDAEFRNAAILWEQTLENVRTVICPALEKDRVVITQGFIGATDENESTTLGREGSDYSAAVFANMLDAENLTIWKDVEAVMNADPKQFDSAEPIGPQRRTSFEHHFFS